MTFPYDLVEDIEKYQDSLRGLCDFSVQVGCDPWGSRAPRPPPKWRSEIRDLVVTVI